MKKIICLLALSCVTTTVFAYQGFGICNFGKESVPSIVCNGPAVLKDTTVTGDVNVVGPFNAINVSVGPVTITGNTEMQGAQVNGPATITGSLQATEVTFAGDVHVIADNILLHHSKITGSMLVSAQTTTPHLVMECGSTVTGNVKFEGKAGIIEITDDSVVQGKINNGSMIFIKKEC